MKHNFFLAIFAALLSLTSFAKSAFNIEAWQQTQPIITKIEQHPFNKALLTGDLSPEYFKVYLAQDGYYLIDFEKVARHLQQQLTSQQKKHFRLIDTVSTEGSYNKAPLDKITMANYSYTQFLLTIDQLNNPALTIAAMLPCQWLYQHLYQQTSKANPYHYWLR